MDKYDLDGVVPLFLFYCSPLFSYFPSCLVCWLANVTPSDLRLTLNGRTALPYLQYESLSCSLSPQREFASLGGGVGVGTVCAGYRLVGCGIYRRIR